MDSYRIGTNWRETRYIVHWEFFNMMKTGSKMIAWHELKNVSILFLIIPRINWSEWFVKWSNLLPLIVNIKEIQLIGIKEKN